MSDDSKYCSCGDATFSVGWETANAAANGPAFFGEAFEAMASDITGKCGVCGKFKESDDPLRNPYENF